MLLAFSWFPVCAHSDVVSEVELTDGSRLKADIVSLQDGVYTLHSESIGEIKIPAEKIKTIRLTGTLDPPAPPAPASQAAAPNIASQAGNMRLSVMQNPENMDKILSLQDDPLIESILKDPKTMQAINAGDIGSLLADPKIQTLMQHPTVRGLSQQYEE
jgi:hypothetical protein